jgi:N-acetylglucosaminyldiphosphoundecaprenol N-acetyl-beta-D-mannosaminyltransferase
LTTPLENARVDVLGVHVSAVDMGMSVDRIARWLAESASTYVCVTGVHGVMEAQRDPDLKDIHNRSGLTVPDGMPMVWAGHYAGAHWMQRVYGPDLMLNVLERAESQGWSSFFYGGAPGTADLLVSRLRLRFPGLRVAGTRAPPFRPLTPEEDTAVVAEIRRSDARLVWVGLSTPKQERWMAEHCRLLPGTVLLGVGAAFDFHAGLLSQAPHWMQQRGLEWAYRLRQEPRRLWRRYLRNNPAFATRILLRRPRLLPG